MCLALAFKLKSTMVIQLVSVRFLNSISSLNPLICTDILIRVVGTCSLLRGWEMPQNSLYHWLQRDGRLWISWFPRLRFCGRCRNTEFAFTIISHWHSNITISNGSTHGDCATADSYFCAGASSTCKAWCIYSMVKIVGRKKCKLRKKRKFYENRRINFAKIGEIKNFWGNRGNKFCRTRGKLKFFEEIGRKQYASLA